jgi:hypothetical protein
MTNADEVDRRVAIYQAEEAARRRAREEEAQRCRDLMARRLAALEDAPRLLAAEVTRVVAQSTRYPVVAGDRSISCGVNAAGAPVRMTLIEVLVERSGPVEPIEFGDEEDEKSWEIRYAFTQYLPVVAEEGFYTLGELPQSGWSGFDEAVTSATDAVLDCLAFAIAEGLEVLPAEFIPTIAQLPPTVSIPLPSKTA